MSGSCEISLFNNAVSAFLSVIGTFLLLVRFGCVFKSSGARINKTPRLDQAKVEEDISENLIKLVEPTQNSDRNLTSKEKAFSKTKQKVASDKKKDKKEKLYSNERNEHQILIQKIPDVGQHKTQSTQQDDFKDSKTIAQIHSGEQYRKRKSVMDKRCKSNNLEVAREDVAKNQSREEEPSTLEGVASIDRDDAPSAISQFRNGGSVKTNIVSRRVLSKGGQTKRKFVKKS
ncbi:hypothetical protein ACH3XW_22250 [Acanthocheilonema viteae]|uniref:Uncharacterized protein n=1 Tax=Acanthocheilonema viteae TaxID=6277 RepID=A0A498SJT1_ACAVI|nr:unnamed protein product [Acanthocheilonema viteae]